MSDFHSFWPGDDFEATGMDVTVLLVLAKGRFEKISDFYSFWPETVFQNAQSGLQKSTRFGRNKIRPRLR